MLGNHDTIFNIPYSLPSNTHSIAIATRRPTAGYTQSSKYMPDYGGILEIPGGHFKNNGLASGLPFFPRPYYIRVIGSNPVDTQAKLTSPDCLAVTSYLESHKGCQFTAIRALGSILYFDSIDKISANQGSPPSICRSTSYAHIPYSYNISGIKYRDQLNDLLLVKFEQGVKLLRLNKLYQLPTQSLHGESRAYFQNQSPIDFIESFPERQGHYLKDACLSYHSQSICIASTNAENLQVRLYDISRSKKLFNSMNRKLNDNSDSTGDKHKTTAPRRQSLRSFAPARRSVEVVQQLEKDPSHLFNMTITTSDQIAVIDPRLNRIGQIYVDKNDLSSFLPTEQFRRSEFSKCCDYQFYSLSNMNVRIFDRRYLSSPISMIAHMLTPTSHDSMDLKMVSLHNDEETLCLSSLGQLCFVSFDRSRARVQGDQIVTPRSMHQPLHEPSPTEITGNRSDELIGLATSTESIFDDGVAFSVLQLSQEGDVCIRGYQPDQSSSLTFKTKAEMIIQQDNTRKFTDGKQCYDPEIDGRDVCDSDEDTEYSTEFLDVLNTSDVIAAGDNLASKRASEKFRSMRDRLRRK